jgi:ATP-dependent DNA helicase RecG
VGSWAWPVYNLKWNPLCEVNAVAKPIFNPRKMMEMAIEVMRSSVPEQRLDGKPSPLVGALLVRSDGSIVTAARGELRDGDHAEFTLLERKCRGDSLDGSVLFATLEPCLERNAPKRGCARHIVNARIKEVWVGVEDDNPTVAGKGIQYLQQRGVTVHMFDPDLQGQILAANKVFFEWARLQVEQPKAIPIRLSKYEAPLLKADLVDLSQEALNQYRTKVAGEGGLDSDSFTRLLVRQGLIVQDGEVNRPTGFGFLLFGSAPRTSVTQAGVLARAEFGDGTSARESFDQAMVLIPGKLEVWLKKVLPSTLDRSTMERREAVDLPFEMIREAVINALVHRDYDIDGEKCQLVVNADTIVIKSPGGPTSPVTLEQLRSFSAPTKSRNPILHFVFARLGLAEEQGYGLRSLKREAEGRGLPLPQFAMEGTSLVLTIYRTKAALRGGLTPEIRNSISDDELAAWEFIAGRDEVGSSELGTALEFDQRKAQRVLAGLEELGLVERVGAGRATRYRRRA